MVSHDYEKFSKEYSKLGIIDTFYLGFRDIPFFVEKYVKGKLALDFGCGSGRSTKFLKELGFDTIGVDVNSNMVNQAKQIDSGGRYILINDSPLPFPDFSFDFPENKNIKSGDKIKVVFRNSDIVFYDYYWTEKDYLDVFSETGFKIIKLEKPLATGKENIKWYSETKHPQFAVYILKKDN